VALISVERYRRVVREGHGLRDFAEPPVRYLVKRSAKVSLDELDVALRRIRSGVVTRKIESSTLDFEVPSARLKDTLANLADAAVCFANAAGGTVVLGVADDVPGSAGISGTELAEDTVRRGIYERTSPGLDVSVTPVEFEGARLLRIDVGEGLEVYGTSVGRYSWRRGTDCMPMTADDVGRLREERRGDDWSARSARHGGVELVDPAVLVRVRGLLSGLPDQSGVAGLRTAPDRDLVAGLGLLTPHGVLTRAGELMLARRRDDAPGIIYQYRRVGTGEPDAVLRLKEPLLVAVQRLIEAIELRLTHTPLNLVGGQQVAVPDFPPVVVREALMNAVVHGDHPPGGPSRSSTHRTRSSSPRPVPWSRASRHRTFSVTGTAPASDHSSPRFITWASSSRSGSGSTGCIENCCGSVARLHRSWKGATRSR
jgi:ATP-dependent DNA helicase RecG